MNTKHPYHLAFIPLILLYYALTYLGLDYFFLLLGVPAACWLMWKMSLGRDERD